MKILTEHSLLRFEHISFAYRPKHAPVLQDVQLAIPTGSLTTILGPNGVGKSTLLFLALGWLKPLNGHIWLNSRRQQELVQRWLISLEPGAQPTSWWIWLFSLFSC